MLSQIFFQIIRPVHVHLKTDKVDLKKRPRWKNKILHFFSIDSSSRHEKRCQMLQTLFLLFQCSKNPQCPTFIFSTQSKSSSRYCLKILRSLPQLAPLFCPERTATFWRDFSAIQSISVTAVKKRFWRQQAILSPTGHAGAPPAPVGRPAGTALAGRRSANSWLSVLHAIPLVVQIVVGHLLSLVPTYVRLLVQRLSVVL